MSEAFDPDGFGHEVWPINGLEMHVARCGVVQRRGSVIVFLHGFPDLWCGWARIMATLGGRHACIAPDQRGYNLTSRPSAVEAYRPENLLADIACLIDRVSPDRPVMLAGHDWGGVLASWFCVERPERVSRLVLVNATHPALLQRTIWRDPVQRLACGYITSLRSGAAERAWLTQDGAALAAARTAAARLAGTMSSAEASLYEAAWACPEAWRAMVDWYRAAPFEIAEGPGETDWTQTRSDWTVRTPTLVVWGDEDPYFLRPLCDRLVEYIPDVRFTVLAGVGHNPLREAPGDVARAIGAFIEAERG